MKKRVGKRKSKARLLPGKSGAFRRGFVVLGETVPFQNHIIPFFPSPSQCRQRFWRAFPIWGFPVLHEEGTVLYKENQIQLKPTPPMPLCPPARGDLPSLLSRANTSPAHPREPPGRSYFPSERSAVLRFDISSIDQPLRQ